MKKALIYGTGLIALYLVVANATGTAKIASSGSLGLAGIIKALQGRS